MLGLLHGNKITGRCNAGARMLFLRGERCFCPTVTHAGYRAGTVQTAIAATCLFGAKFNSRSLRLTPEKVREREY